MKENDLLISIAKAGDLEALKSASNKYDLTQIVNRLGDTLLHYASAKGHVDLVAFLISQGCDINKEGSFSKRPINLAIDNDHLNIVQYLISKGATINNDDFVQAVLGGHDRIVKFLLKSYKNYFDLIMADVEGETLLHLCTQTGNCNMVNLLLEAGASPNIPNERGYTPLHEAADLGRLDIAKLLIKYGADINGKYFPSFDAPIHLAVVNNKLAMVDYLLSLNADKTLTNGSLKTSLELARQLNFQDIIHLLQNKK